MPKGARTARRLKVYRAHLGFDESVVAAPNQGEALAAWGVRQNLFAEGEASVETDPKIVEAALEHPGTPLRRPVGGKGRFGLDARAPETLPPVKRPPAKRTRAEPKPRRKAEPDRSEIDAAEGELERLEKGHREALGELDRRRERMEEDARDIERAWRRTREAAERRLAKARREYEHASKD